MLWWATRRKGEVECKMYMEKEKEVYGRPRKGWGSVSLLERKWRGMGEIKERLQDNTVGREKCEL